MSYIPLAEHFVGTPAYTFNVQLQFADTADNFDDIVSTRRRITKIKVKTLVKGDSSSKVLLRVFSAGRAHLNTHCKHEDGGLKDAEIQML